ncbi:MAG: general secretion pathway protein GspK [Candidatus Hydrogenedentes bacterium]|nr:general secretion pathway protein GspK [Candidatus Hydrogenedentota bacterium]
MSTKPRYAVNSHFRRSDAGTALVLALGLLAVFAMLSVAWVDFMVIENKDTELDLAAMRAEQAAAGGVQNALASLEAAVAAGTSATAVASPIELEFPVYTKDLPAQNSLVANENILVKTTVTVTEESSKVNLNFAPPKVLCRVLGVSLDQARQIRSNLPRIDGSPASPEDAVSRRWLSNADELVLRGLMKPSAYAAVDASLITVHSVADPNNAAAFINVNTAPIPVLEAILDITPETAAAVASARPFESIDALAAAAGKGPEAFNLRQETAAPGTLPQELSFSPRAWRIVSESEVQHTYTDRPSKSMGSARVEAVVALDAQGASHITYWNQGRS